MKKFAVVMCLLVFVGCQAIPPEPSRDDTTEPLPTSAEEAEHSPISVDIGVPEQVKVGESFHIHATLENTTDQSIEITTGDPVFYYIIRDSNGKALNTITRTDVGVVQTLDKKEMISEKHTYIFNKPGIYDISVVADFTLSDKDHSNQIYQVDSEPKKIQVLE
ncbi:hypothetical protein [Paenibacillus barengoltzii]|uniref:hypothetical protein n=1 Tax=Paenibacillus barengoltzii TaxID=343517 RepID=UPI000FDC51AE|nr:hypothetical protein [Paenibacillus barengoltzii]